MAHRREFLQAARLKRKRVLHIPTSVRLTLLHVPPAPIFHEPKSACRIGLFYARFEPDGSWKQQYSFSLQPRRLEEFAAMCHFHQTSSESSFTQKRICSRATAEGRVTVSEMKLIVTSNGQREERKLNSAEEWGSTLREQFGITL